MLDDRSKFQLIAGLACFIVAILVTYAADSALTERCLTTAAVQADAVVTDKVQTSGRSGRILQVAYRFKDSGGATFEGRNHVRPDRFKAAQIGATTTVLYCTGNPSRHALDLAQHSRERRRSTELALLALLASAAWILVSLVQAAIDRMRREPPPDDDSWRTSTSNRYPKRVAR